MFYTDTTERLNAITEQVGSPTYDNTVIDIDNTSPVN